MRHEVGLRDTHRHFGRWLARGATALSFMCAVTVAAHAQTFTVSVGYGANAYGRGTVRSVPAGIDCTVQFPESSTGTCTAPFQAGSTVTLTVTPLSGGTFERWIGYGCETNTTPSCTITVNKTYAGSVGIKPIRYPVTIVGAGNGVGTITAVDPFPYYLQVQLSCRIVLGVASQLCTTTYPHGSRVQLDHTTGSTGGSRLAGYGECPSPGCFALVEGPLTITARFVAPRIDIVGAGAGSGRVVAPTGLGLDCTIIAGATSGNCSRNSDRTEATTLFFSATPNAGSVFAGWAGLCTGFLACATVGAEPPSNTQLVARFDLATFPLTVSGSGSGAGSVQSSPAGIACSIAAGTTSNTCVAQLSGTITLTAAPGTGSAFSGWSGACSGIGTCTVTMSEARSVSARFDGTAATLTVSGTGSGSVSSLPAGVACSLDDGTTSGSCSVVFGVGSTVTLTATPASGWTFLGWAGACSGTGTCQPDLSQDRAVTVAFRRAPVTLSVKGTGTGNGVVTAPLNAINCVITKGTPAATGCDGVFDQHAVVTLTADPQGGSTFGGWEGDGVTCTALICTLTVAQSRSVTARFTAPRAAREIALALLGQVTLTVDERAQLDRFGNKDGTFNLGDFIALLDRTGERLTPDLDTLLRTHRQPSVSQTTQRRIP